MAPQFDKLIDKTNKKNAEGKTIWSSKQIKATKMTLNGSEISSLDAELTLEADNDGARIAEDPSGRIRMPYRPLTQYEQIPERESVPYHNVREPIAEGSLVSVNSANELELARNADDAVGVMGPDRTARFYDRREVVRDRPSVSLREDEVDLRTMSQGGEVLENPNESIANVQGREYREEMTRRRAMPSSRFSNPMHPSGDQAKQEVIRMLEGDRSRILNYSISENADTYGRHLRRITVEIESYV